MATEAKLIEYVITMRQTNKNKEICENEKNLLNKCILCKWLLSSQKWGKLIENYVKERFHILPSEGNRGDGIRHNKIIEIKVSLGCEDGQINFVQIRPNHKVDYYLFIAYVLNEGVKGEVYTFCIPSHEINKLLLKYGTYAHGSKKVFGNINKKIIKNSTHEFALRPNPLSKTKTKKLWDEFMKYNIKFSRRVFDRTINSKTCKNE